MEGNTDEKSSILDYRVESVKKEIGKRLMNYAVYDIRTLVKILHFGDEEMAKVYIKTISPVTICKHVTKEMISKFKFIYQRQSNNTGIKVLTLHNAEPCSIPGTIYSLLRKESRVNPKHCQL